MANEVTSLSHTEIALVPSHDTALPKRSQDLSAPSRHGRDRLFVVSLLPLQESAGAGCEVLDLGELLVSRQRRSRTPAGGGDFFWRYALLRRLAAAKARAYS